MPPGPDLGRSQLTSARAKVLKAGNLVTAETTQYASPAGQSVEIKSATLCNTTGGAVTVNLSIVPAGGTAGAGNRILSAESLAAGAKFSLKDYLVGAQLADGDFISTSTSATGVTLTLTGIIYGG